MSTQQVIVSDDYVDFMESIGMISGKLSSAQLRKKKPEMLSAMEKIARGEIESPKSWFGKIFEFFGFEN